MAGKKIPLAGQIFIALVLGIITGLLMQGHAGAAVKYIKPFGTLFLNLVKFVVVPIVLFSITTGVVSMGDIRKVGVIGVKTVVYYMCTTLIAVVLGLVVANIFKGIFMPLSTSDIQYAAKEAPSLIDTLVNIAPSNALKPLLDSNMLQVIVIALLFGIAAIKVGEKAKPFNSFIQSANEVSINMMESVIAYSPIGVFGLMTPVVAENGSKVLGSLGAVLAVTYIGYILHSCTVYPICVKLFAKISPITFFKEMSSAMMLAFSSASSVGTLPLNMECTKRLGAKEEIADFCLPLGATINMDGTAIYQAVCATFIASCYGINLTLGQQLTIVATATLASIGTAGVPGAGMIMLAMVLESVNLPVEGIALVAGIDRIFDMGRTTVNITGDACGALVITGAKKE